MKISEGIDRTSCFELLLPFFTSTKIQNFLLNTLPYFKEKPKMGNGAH